jgi:hypothetical protein
LIVLPKMPLFSPVPPFYYKFRQPTEKMHAHPRRLSHIFLSISAFRVFLSNNLLSLCYKANKNSNDAKSIKTTKSAKPSEIKISSTF